jgi:hypothetical protein
MDVSYLVLFINFFLQSYVIGGGKAKYQKGKNGALSNGVHHQNGTAAVKNKKRN